MSRLFGQISEIPESNEGRERQREWALGKAQEITTERLAHRMFNPIGIPFLAYICLEDMKHNRALWPDIPAQDGMRRRIQELADDRFFMPTPLVNLPIRFKDVDPEASSGVYEVVMRPTSCYLLNPFYCMEEGSFEWFDIAKEFAFKVLRVSNMVDLKEAFQGTAEITRL